MAGTTRNIDRTTTRHSPPSDFLAAINAAGVDLELLRSTLKKVDAALDQVVKPDGVIGGTLVVATAAAVTLAVTGFIQYRLGGVIYTVNPAATITLQDLGDITQNNFGAWRLEIDALGAMTAVASPTVGGESTAQKALLSLASVAPTANAVTFGYWTVSKTDSAFNIGTTNTNAASTTSVVYHERGPRKRISGLNAARSVVSAANAGAVNFTDGTVNVNVNGVKVAQIAASATRAVTDADTIATVKFGAWVFCTDLAGTAIVSISALGLVGAQAMSYATAALALAAANLVVDRLPSMFVPVMLVQVSNGAGGTFTAKTTFWDAASVVTTVTDAGVAGWDTAVPTGFNSHQITAVLPATTDIATASAITIPALNEIQMNS